MGYEDTGSDISDCIQFADIHEAVFGRSDDDGGSRFAGLVRQPANVFAF